MRRNDKRTILVPLDLAECTASLVTRAARAAEDAGATVVLLHVTQLPAGVSARTAVQTDDGDHEQAAMVLERDARAQLQPYLNLLTARGLEARALVALGEPAAQIIAAAERVGAESIVMGTHGRRGLSRWLQGSVAERVLRRAKVPVLTVRTKHEASCSARSCAWCPVAQSEALQRVLAEAEG